jgi:Protein of unknown function (DUF2711)
MTDLKRLTELPDFNDKYLEWYKEVFDCVYIALHPFSSVQELNPASVNYRIAVFDGNKTTEGEREALLEERTLNTEMDRTAFAKLEKQFGEQISWQTICDECNFDSLAQLNRVLLTTNMAIRPEDRDENGVARLEEYCLEHKLFMPVFNWIPPLLQKPLTEIFEALGLSNFVISDHFYQSKSMSLAHLNSLKPWTTTEKEWDYVSKVYPPDGSIFVAAPIDEFYTVICGNQKTFGQISLPKRFDGFWCTDNIRPAWWQTEAAWVERKPEIEKRRKLQN